MKTYCVMFTLRNDPYTVNDANYVVGAKNEIEAIEKASKLFSRVFTSFKSVSVHTILETQDLNY